jgi:hypothetical protein
MINKFILVLVIILIIYLIYKIITSGNYDKFGVFNNLSYFMSRPNCPQLNNKTICKSTPGCRLMLNTCTNNLSDLRKYEKPIPEWMKDNFMIVY